MDEDKNKENISKRNKMDKDDDSDDNDDVLIQKVESPKDKNEKKLHKKYLNYKNNNKNTEIILNSVTAVRSKNICILKNISFSLDSSGLILIVGGNACGKTSLLLSIINELEFTVGESSIKPNEVKINFFLLSYLHYI